MSMNPTNTTPPAIAIRAPCVRSRGGSLSSHGGKPANAESGLEAWPVLGPVAGDVTGNDAGGNADNDAGNDAGNEGDNDAANGASSGRESRIASLGIAAGVVLRVNCRWAGGSPRVPNIFS